MNIFETATRNKFRFPSARGELTTEQLWDLPLTSKNSFDLDTVARTVNGELKAVSEESFVTPKVNPNKGSLEVKLEIIKHVIATKLAEADKRQQAQERAEKRRKILEALASKEDEALSQASKDDLLKQLAELDAG